MAFRQNRMFWYFFTEYHLISRFRNATGQIGGWFTIPGRQRKSAGLVLICKTKASNQQTVCEFTKERVTYGKPIAGKSRQSEVLCALKELFKITKCCVLSSVLSGNKNNIAFSCTPRATVFYYIVEYSNFTRVNVYLKTYESFEKTADKERCFFKPVPYIKFH